MRTKQSLSNYKLALWTVSNEITLTCRNDDPDVDNFSSVPGGGRLDNPTLESALVLDDHYVLVLLERTNTLS